MSPRALARYVNDLLDSDQISVTEMATGPVTLHGVDTPVADKLIMLARAAAWRYELIDSADAEVTSGDLTQYLPPFHVTIHKVARSDEVLFVSTKAFGQWIDGPEPAGAVQVADATMSFQTEMFSVAAYEEQPATFDRADDRKSPLETVKCIGACSSLPSDIRPYLLKEGSPTPWGDKAFETWVRIAARKLMCVVTSEVHAATSIIEFSGPPRIVLTSVEAVSLSVLGTKGFLELQSAARWIYELDRETETRHKLFTIEFARSVPQGTEVSLAFKEATAAALEGARIAHSFGLLELSKDALKAMSDLRKAVTEETTKLSEAMRQLSLSVAGAIFYGLALIAAKLASVVNPLLLDAMALVGASYVGLIVLINYRHLVQQRILRERWRDKFYRFLRADDYKSMVEQPLTDAEGSLKLAMSLALGMTAVAFIAVIFNNHLG